MSENTPTTAESAKGIANRPAYGQAGGLGRRAGGLTPAETHLAELLARIAMRLASEAQSRNE